MTYEVGAAECAGDEVEDLRGAPRGGGAKMLSVRAVSAGAILSDYQRLRVEAVCSDLGLVSLAYLWQQPQSSVLGTSSDSHVHAVLVKVAAMGLEPKKHLGATLAGRAEDVARNRARVREPLRGRRWGSSRRSCWTARSSNARN